MRSLLKLGLVLGLVVSSFGLAEGRLSGRYYTVIFGYQGLGNRPTDSHTFAAFYEGSNLERGITSYPASISWLPATGIVRPVRRERGRNFSLEETLGIAQQRGYEVKAFGPFEISSDLYYRALSQIQLLESGAVDYRMAALAFSREAKNCIHAVSDINGLLETGANWGFKASALVAQHFAADIYGYPQANYNVARIIQLDRMVSRRPVFFR